MLLARLRSHLRQKYDIDSSDPRLQIGHLPVFPIRRTCQIADRQPAISGNEFELLMHLIKHAGQRISREELHTLVIPEPWSPSDRNIDLRISRLRQKLGSHETSGLQIRSVRNVGYELVQAT